MNINWACTGRPETLEGIGSMVVNKQNIHSVSIGKMKYKHCSYNSLLYYKPAPNLVASSNNYFVISYDFVGLLVSAGQFFCPI